MLYLDKIAEEVYESDAPRDPTHPVISGWIQFTAGSNELYIGNIFPYSGDEHGSHTIHTNLSTLGFVTHTYSRKPGHYQFIRNIRTGIVNPRRST